MSATGRNTVYQQYVRDMLWRMALDGVGRFNIREFAELAGLKITINLRRQLRYAVRDNIIQYVIGRVRPDDPYQYYTFTEEILIAAGRVS